MQAIITISHNDALYHDSRAEWRLSVSLSGCGAWVEIWQCGARSFYIGSANSVLIVDCVGRL